MGPLHYWQDTKRKQLQDQNFNAEFTKAGPTLTVGEQIKRSMRPVLHCVERNDADGRMAVLLVTGYAQGPFVPNDHRVCSQCDTRTMHYLDRDDYQRQERWDARKIPHKTPLIPTLVVLLGECAYEKLTVKSCRTVRYLIHQYFQGPRLRHPNRRCPGFSGYRHHDFPDSCLPLLPHVFYPTVVEPAAPSSPPADCCLRLSVAVCLVFS